MASSQATSPAGLGFECEATGSRPPANISWFLDGRPMDPGFSHASLEGNVSRSILLMPASERQARLLECRATNGQLPHDRGVVSRFFKVDLSHKPEVSLRLGTGLNGSHITEGSDVYLECSVVAASRITDVAWYHEGRELKGEGQEALVTSRYLVIRQVTRKEMGRYTCRATSAEGETVESPPFYLRVQHAPRCRSREETRIPLGPNDVVNVTCDVEADPSDDLSYSWLIEDDAGKTRPVPGAGARSRTVQLLAQLRLHHAALFCWARNSVGEQRERCRFNFILKLEASRDLSCTAGNYTDTSFTLRCRTSRRNVTRLRFEVYDATMRNRSERAFWSAQPDGVSVGGLTPATDYLVVVRTEGAVFETYVRTLTPAQTLKGRSGSPTGSRWTQFTGITLYLCGIAAVTAILLGTCLVVFLKHHRHRRKRSARRATASSEGGDHKVYIDADVF
ncbi:unnamed protein product [Ixodes persulcatus]